ncbi:hypothetical protein [Aquimarina aquimarini]|uniref:hypothetical protein n=1 Tax=Aquimarina aquimarini TaxID=1191734 RepID=UPI000D55F08C|nr:hypothetical protein [Aquimarina aquimarini]
MNPYRLQLVQIILVALIISSCSESDKEETPIDPPSDPPKEENYYFDDNFDTYENGISLSSLKPFDAAGRTTVSNEQSYSGNYAAKMEIHQGDQGGFGQWGGIIPITPSIKKGGEIWVRLRVYWPSSFIFNATPYMKFLRLHNKSGNGENAGYNDLYVDQADQTTTVLRCIKEFHNIWETYDGHKIPRDTWETYEMYLAVDNKSVDQGGSARMRIWRDAKLIFDRTDAPTITDENGEIDYFYLFTYWNNETPPTNYVYVDDLTITTHDNPPINKDINGNPFIGN